MRLPSRHTNSMGKRVTHPATVHRIPILEWLGCDRGVTILAARILIRQGRDGRVKIIDRSSYNAIVERIRGISRRIAACSEEYRTDLIFGRNRT